MHHRYCNRRYKLWKFLADIVLLLLTQGLWVLYIIWRIVRPKCVCHVYMGRC